MRLTSTRALALGLGLLAALIATDVTTDSEALTATFMLPVFLVALAAPPRTVAVVGVLALAAAVCSRAWTDAGSLESYLIRDLAVLVGGVFAVFAARQREAVSEAREELDAALGNLADAVTVQDEHGGLVYANNAAAELLGCASAEELLATRPEDLVARFESFTEDGAPLDPRRLPGRQALRGEDPQPLTIRAVNKATGEERWQIVKATSIAGPEGRGRRAINVIEDMTETKRAEIAQRLLAEASDALASSLDYEATLQEVARMAVPRFADWCGVSMPRQDGSMDQVAVAHADPDKVRFAHELNARYPSRIDDPGTRMVVEAGGATVIEVTDELLRESAQDDEHYRLIKEIGLRSAIGAPMFAGDEFLGTISFVTSDEGRRLTEHDLDVADELARRASVAIQNARMFEERSRAARTLEQALRPPELPPIPGWRSATMYEPASEGGLVGGDFYDAFEAREGWLVVIGDVGGRGVDAAALTAMARYTLRTAGAMSDDPIDALDRLNAWLLEREGVELCTAALVLLRPDGSIRVCSAGHPPPLVVAGGRAEPWGPRGSILGAFEEAIWELEERVLRPGEQLVLYTDGLFELSGSDGRLGEARLAEVFSGVDDPAAAVRKARSTLLEFAGGRFADDMAMVVLEREA
ncbi:MAG TPA: SpoIIE family protein phosphatase [Solirubrobacterales bacterium]